MLFQRLGNKEVIFVVSDLLRTELKGVPERVGNLLDNYSNDNFEIVGILAGWNFTHIVNLTRIKGYNGVNLKNGYQTLEIRNPKDLIDQGKEI